MDTEPRKIDNPRMGKVAKQRVAPRQKREPVRARTLYLGQWLTVLDKRPVDIAKAIGCTEGYLSLLISGKQRKNPSTQFMLDLSDELGVSVNALFSPPPSQDVAGNAEKLSPRQWAAFLEVLAMRPGRGEN